MNQILELLEKGKKLRVIRKMQSDLTGIISDHEVYDHKESDVHMVSEKKQADVCMISADGNLTDCLHLAAELEGPLILETCFHKVFRYGLSAFAADLQKAGISAVRVPDLPYEERGQLAVYLLDSEGPFLISEITPASGDRIMAITRYARGFVWCLGRGIPEKLRELPGDPLEYYLYAVDAACPIPYLLDLPGRTEDELAAYADGAEGAAGYAILHPNLE